MTHTLASSVREVQVFRRGALVVRRAALPAGTTGEVALEGLPLCLLDESVRAAVEVADPAMAARAPRPADVRAELVVPPLGALLAPPAPEELRAQERAIAELEARIGGLHEEVEALGRLRLALPAWKEEAPPRPVPVGAWLEALEWQRRAWESRAAERAELDRELTRAREELARLHRREVEARAKRDARADAVSKRVVLLLRGEPLPAPATLRVEYRVPGAWWVPRYALRLARDGKSARLSLRAHVVQNTGEPWERVRLFASTADLLRETALPELTSIRIGRRQPPPARRAWREPPGRDATLEEGLEQAWVLLRQASALAAREAGSAELARFGRGGPPPGADAFSGPADSWGPGAGDPFATGSFAADPFGPPPGGRMDSDELELDDDALSAPSEPVLSGPFGAPPPPPTGRPMPPSAPPRPASPAAMPAKMMMAARDAAPPQELLRKSVATKGGAARARRSRHDDGAEGGRGAPAAEAAPSGEPEPLSLEPELDLLRYGGLALQRWERDRASAGTLRRLGLEDQLEGLEAQESRAVLLRLARARQAADGVAHLPLPPFTARVEASAGHYDHRYDAEGPVDVPSDGQLHDVPLLSQEAPVRTRLVAVPRESDEAVRVATLQNPLQAPLLSGPAEVYLGDEFLVTTPLRTVPTGGDLELGLGVEPGLKVARNTFYEEVSTGLLGGGLSLKHRLELTVASRLPGPVEVEVRELLPIKDDDDQAVTVVEEGVAPPWEKLPRQEDGSEPKGARRWRISLGPGEEKKLLAGYRLEIDAKQELQGGNRRA